MRGYGNRHTARNVLFSGMMRHLSNTSRQTSHKGFSFSFLFLFVNKIQILNLEFKIFWFFVGEKSRINVLCKVGLFSNVVFDEFVDGEVVGLGGGGRHDIGLGVRRDVIGDVVLMGSGVRVSAVVVERGRGGDHVGKLQKV